VKIKRPANVKPDKPDMTLDEVLEAIPDDMPLEEVKKKVGNKYLDRLDEAVAEDAYACIKIFEHCKGAILELQKSDLSGEVKYTASKKMKKFVQDVYSSIPNQYRQKVEDLVQEAIFPEQWAEAKAKAEAAKGTAEAVADPAPEEPPPAM
jgi:hypothetical protein